MEKVTYSHRQLSTIAKLPLDLSEGLLKDCEWAPKPLSRETLIESAKAREDYPIDRSVLTQVLKEQYVSIKPSKAVKKNLRMLGEDHSRTITTGHQLNTFTGPSYFIYKILHVCRLAEEMNNSSSDYHWIPVYWMATEDHDFDEINHAWIRGEKYQWSSSETGPVGRFRSDPIGYLIDDLKRRFVDFHGLDKVLDIFEPYRTEPTLAGAMRKIVNSLFEAYGLVIVDGDDARLKRSLWPVLEKEIKDSVVLNQVEQTVATWPKDYKVQVTPRDINFFYILDGYRERITKENGALTTADEQYAWESIDALRKEFESFPERFSPNVLTRPMYQELILPNVAYVGGGAEVSYWLELKSAFRNVNVFYPLVQLRTSVTLIEETSVNKLKELGLDVSDIFGDIVDLERRVVEEQIPSLEKERAELETWLKALSSKITAIDGGLDRSMRSLFEVTVNRLSRLEKKIVRATKKANSTSIERLHAGLSQAYPEGVLQERRMNVIDFLMSHGSGLLEDVYEHIDPFDEQNMTVLIA